MQRFISNRTLLQHPLLSYPPHARKKSPRRNVRDHLVADDKLLMVLRSGPEYFFMHGLTRLRGRVTLSSGKHVTLNTHVTVDRRVTCDWCRVLVSRFHLLGTTVASDSILVPSFCF